MSFLPTQLHWSPELYEKIMNFYPRAAATKYWQLEHSIFSVETATRIHAMVEVSMRCLVCWGASLCPLDPLSVLLCSITQTRLPPSFLLAPGNEGPCLETGAQERGWIVPSPIAESLQGWLDSRGSGTRINQWIWSQKTQGSPALQLGSSVNWVGHPETKSQFPLKLNRSSNLCPTYFQSCGEGQLGQYKFNTNANVIIKKFGEYRWQRQGRMLNLVP